MISTTLINQLNSISIRSEYTIDCTPRNEQRVCSDESEDVLDDIMRKNKDMLLKMKDRIIRMGKSCKIDSESGEDLFQEVCLKLLRTKRTVVLDPRVIIATVKNMRIDMIRKNNNYRELKKQTCCEEYNPFEDIFQQNHLKAKIHSAISELSPKLRDAIISSFLESESVSEGSKRLGITESAYRSRIKVGLKKLKNMKTLNEIGETK